jgi:SAM-dependent methyltransferase
VCAVDPSSSFVDVVRDRFPELDVRSARAEELPFPDAAVDLVLAQLVVHFIREPVRGIAEMARVARPGGTVAVNVWDHFGGAGPLAAFWDAVRTLDPGAPDESDLPGVREGHLAELFGAAGLPGPVSGSLTVEVGHESFEQWWQPFTLGVGPAGAYVAGLDEAATERLREACRELLPDGPFRTVATAWTARATVPER